LCNSCASLAGLVLSFIACFILLVIAPLEHTQPVITVDVANTMACAIVGFVGSSATHAQNRCRSIGITLQTVSTFSATCTGYLCNTRFSSNSLNLPKTFFKIVLHHCFPYCMHYYAPRSRLYAIQPVQRTRWSSSTLQLLVPPYRLTTIGRRSFPVAASIVWNSLPVYRQSSQSLFTFRQRSKTCLFQQSFPDIVI